jgi:glycosyltransferase involved in cell wall biosynthesis
MSTTVSVIIPAYNEEKTILQVLRKVAEQRVDGVAFETIVVDDGSKDRTVELLEENPGLYSRLVKQPRNGGKGAAVRAGLAAASGDYILFQDADLEYDPSDYGKLLLPAVRFNADIVMGSRIAAPPCTRVAYFWHKAGNRFLTFVFNILNNTTFTDTYSCYLVYRRSLIKPEELKTDGWEQQAEILSLAVRRGKVYYEVPISYFGRTYDEGKKIRAHHIIAVIQTIISCRLFRS